jgi:hypothetical protein
MSDEPERQEPPGEAAREAAEEVAASLVEHRSLIRSLVSGPVNAIPLETGDPVPGGIRPGPGTGHKPSAETESEGSSSSSGSPPKPE